MKKPSHRPVVRARRGVTLVELIVAMTVLSIGLLAIVGTSSAIARSLGEARLDNLAAMLAESRFEKLSSAACCTPFTDGVCSSSSSLSTTVTADTTRGIIERFVVLAPVNSTRKIIDSVSWTPRKTTRTVVFQTIIPCRPGA